MDKVERIGYSAVLKVCKNCVNYFLKPENNGVKPYCMLYNQYVTPYRKGCNPAFSSSEQKFN